MGIWDKYVAGVQDEESYNAAPKVNAIDPSAYTIGGMDQYQGAMGQAGQEFGQAEQGANAGIQGVQGGQNVQDQQALQKYLQSVAMGQAPSAADQMLQNQQAQLAQRQQSQMVSAGGGMNPALAMRQLFQGQNTQGAQLAGQGAAQKLQEQEQFGRMAQQGGAQLHAQEMGAVQQQFQNSMDATKARADIASGIFNANRAQTGYNVDHAQNQQAYQMMQRAEYQQHEQDQARSTARIGRAVIGGGLTIGGAALGSMTGNPMGTMMGASMGGSLANSIMGPEGGGGGGFDPSMMVALMHGRNGSNPNSPAGTPAAGGNGTPVVAGTGGSSGYMQGGPKLGPDAAAYPSEFGPGTAGGW